MANEDQVRNFISELLAAVPADQKAAVETALAAETAQAKLRDGVLARSDYSRSQDALRVERERFATEVATAKERINGWNEWYATTTAEVAEREQRLKTYEDTYGHIDNQKPSLTKEDVLKLTQTELERQKAGLLNDHLALVDTLTDLKYEHRDRFKENLDTKDFLRFAQESGLPPKIAYREFIAPRVEKQNEVSLAEQLKKAREEGARAALSEHKLPIGQIQREPHVLDLMKDKPMTSAERINAAVGDFNTQISNRS